jgi:Tfp pilus assembly protein PilF
MEPTTTKKTNSTLQDLFESGEIHKFQEEDFTEHAHDFMNRELFLDAKLLFEEGLKKFPHNSDLHFEFGYFLLERGESESARQYLMKVNPLLNPYT